MDKVGFLYFLFQVVYFLAPVGVANMAPVLVKPYFRGLAIPLDGRLFFAGERILGANKTVRGLIVGVIGGVLAVLMQSWLSSFPFFRELSFVDFTKVNVLWLGVLVGLGVIVGDAVGSFVKRRFRIPPGESFMPFDQIVAPLGAMLFIRPFYQVDLVILLSALLISFFLHIVIKQIGYNLKLEKKKW